MSIPFICLYIVCGMLTLWGIFKEFDRFYERDTDKPLLRCNRFWRICIKIAVFALWPILFTIVVVGELFTIAKSLFKYIVE